MTDYRVIPGFARANGQNDRLRAAKQRAAIFNGHQSSLEEKNRPFNQQIIV